MTYTWPDDLPPYRQTFYLQPHTGRSESPFTRQQKTYGLSAPRWICQMLFRGGYDGTEAQGAFGPRLDAFIAKLNGGTSRVGIYDFRRTALRGDNDAASLTNEAALAGDTMMRVSGADPGSLVFREGDYIGGDGRPHLVTGDAYANASGLTVVSFKPALNVDVGAGLAVYGAPRGQFRLVSDDAGASDVEVGTLASYTLDFVEDYWEVAEAMARAPFVSSMDVSSVVPTLADKHAAVRLDDTTFLHRQIVDETGFTEEYVFRRARGTPEEGLVDDGLQLMSWRTFAFGRVYTWLIQPEDPGARTTTEFAFRTGYAYDDTGDPTNAGYHEVEDNVNGFGHGRMTCAGAAIQLNGTGGNLIEVADWPTGVTDKKVGDSMVFTSPFKLLLPDDVEGVDLVFTQTMDSTYGLRGTGFFEALVADVVFQNSPLAMMAFNAGEGAPINAIKLDDEDYVVTPVYDRAQKPEFPSPWDDTEAEYYQGYHTDNPTIVPTLRAIKRVIQDSPGETLDPYEFCQSVRVAVVDQPDFTKVVGYAQSTGDTFPRTAQPLPMGTTYFFDNVRHTRYLPGGPT